MLSLLVTLIIGAGGASDELLIPGRDSGYFGLPPQVACDSKVVDGKWSSDGRYLVLQRERSTLDRKTASKIFQLMTQGIEPPIPPPGIATAPGAVPAARPDTMHGPSSDFTENTLVVWDMTTKTSKVIWKSHTSSERIESWRIGGSVVYLVSIQEVPPSEPGAFPASLRTVQIVSAGDGQTLYKVNLESKSRLNFVDFHASSNTMLVSQGGYEGHNAWLLSVKGARKVEGIPDYLSLQGYPVSGGYMVRVNDESVYRIDSATGLSTRKDIKEYVEPKPTEEKIKLRTQFVSVKAGKASGQARVLIATDPKNANGVAEIVVTDSGSPYAVAPGQTALFYTVEGVALVRELVPVDYLVLKAAKEAAQRAAALSQVKQLGLAIMMFAADNDDIIPTGLSNDQLSPYLKNDDLFVGFNYTFGGGNMTEIQNPADTEMGYVIGPGGRAIVYADGHAKWKPD